MGQIQEKYNNNYAFLSGFSFLSHKERLQLLSGNCPRHLTKPRLRTRLSYRVETAKDCSNSSDRTPTNVNYKCTAAGEQRNARSFFLPDFPDGVVLKECLAEVKRIFPGSMTLKEAVCIRGICKKTSNGLIVNQNHAYMYHCQVQQQLCCSLSIKQSSSFSKKQLPKVQNFLSSVSCS